MISTTVGRTLVSGICGLTSLALSENSAQVLAVALATIVTLTNEEARTAPTAEKLNQNQLVHPAAIPPGNDQKLDNASPTHHHVHRRESVS